MPPCPSVVGPQDSLVWDLRLASTRLGKIPGEEKPGPGNPGGIHQG